MDPGGGWRAYWLTPPFSGIWTGSTGGKRGPHRLVRKWLASPVGRGRGGITVKDRTRPIPSLIKNQRLVEQRRRQIVQGAVDLFVRKGFHKTTAREIARACGLGIGTMYEYIQSKEDVLYLVCDYIHSELERRLTGPSAKRIPAGRA